MITVLKEGKVLKSRPARRYKGTCECCEAEYSCEREDIIEGSISFLEQYVTGLIKCTNCTCEGLLTVVKDRLFKC